MYKFMRDRVREHRLGHAAGVVHAHAVEPAAGVEVARVAAVRVARVGRRGRVGVEVLLRAWRGESGWRGAGVGGVADSA